MVRHLRLFAVAAVVAALAIAARRIDWSGVGHQVAAASLLPLVAALALNLVVRTAARARRTQLLLGGKVALGEVIRMQLAGYAASALLPGPAEEAVCSVQLARGHQLKTREIVRYQVTDKLLGIASIAVTGLALLPPALALAIGSAGIVVLAVARPQLVAPLGYLVVSNAACVVMIALCVTAVGAHVTPLVALRIFMATSLATALPIVPAQIGTLESAFALVAVHAGVSPAAALAAAALYHLAQLAPTAIAGLPLLARLSWRVRWGRA